MLFLLIAFHAGISFMSSELNPELWIFKDTSTSIIFDGLLGFIHTFRHPAFFVISGFVTHQMFQKYSWKEVLDKRFKRLFIPMLITITLIGPIVYMLFAKLMGETNIFSLDVIYPSSQDHPYRISTIYVWFLYYLLLFSLAHLLFEKLGYRRFLEKVNIGKNWFFASISILLFVVIVCLTAWQENSLFGQYHLLPALASLGGYFAFYLFGIFLSSRNNSLTKIENYGIYFVVLGTISFMVYSFKGMQVLSLEGSAMKFNPILMLSSALATVFYSFGFLGLALKYYTTPNKTITYISQSSYFLYLIHFPILLIFLNFSVLQNWNVFVKFFFVLIATTFVSVLINVLWLKLWKNKPPI